MLNLKFEPCFQKFTQFTDSPFVICLFKIENSSSDINPTVDGANFNLSWCGWWRCQIDIYIGQSEINFAAVGAKFKG